jgi:ubiquinol-cytochrome c reductase cytochrome c subunit
VSGALHMLEAGVTATLVAPALARAAAGRARVPPLFGWLVFVGSQWAFHVSPALGVAERSPVAHVLLQAALLAAAVAFWLPVLDGSFGGAARTLYLFLALPAVDLIALWFLASGRPEAGVAMLVGMLPLGVAAVVAAWVWVTDEERRAVLRGAALLALAVLVAPADARAQNGRELYLDRCSSCHGADARGVEGLAPTLRGAGAAALDFYLSTGRMPLADPGKQPLRAEPVLSGDQMEAVTDYVLSLPQQPGPDIPDVDPARGDLALGMEAYTSYCAGCHGMIARGGVVIGAFAPGLVEATPTQVAEAVRVGPYVMPRFDETVIDRRTLDSIVRYVQLTKKPPDEGGWGIGHVGPVPEGLVAWLLGAGVLVGAALLLGERNR